MPTIQGPPSSGAEGTGLQKAEPEPAGDGGTASRDAAADAAAHRDFERRLGRIGDALTQQAEQATRDRVIPALVVLVGVLMVVFWSLAGLVPDGRAWPTPHETTVGLLVGGLVLLGGAALSLLADYWPARAIAHATRAMSETDQAHIASRNKRGEA